MKRIKKLFLIPLACAVLANCQNAADLAPNADITPVRTLAQYASCEETLAKFQQRALAELDEILTDYAECGTYGIYEAPTADGATTTSAAEDAGSAADYTTTNLQEAGVDEADTVKTDGEFLYVATNAGIDVFRVWPLADFGKIAFFPLADGADGLYLDGEMLIALAQGINDENRSETRATFFDVSQPESPQVIKTRTIAGTFSSSRLVDGRLHVLTETEPSYSIWSELSEHLNWSEYYAACGDSDETSQMLALAREEIRQSILATTVADWLPTSGDGETNAVISCTDILYDDSDENTSLVGLTSLALDGESEKTTFLHGRAQQVYASTSSIYFAALRYDTDTTDIHRFKIGDAQSPHDYFGSGSVAGHTLNTFSFGENAGYLRVATTVGQLSRDGSTAISSNVFMALRRFEWVIITIDRGNVPSHLRGEGQGEGFQRTSP